MKIDKAFYLYILCSKRNGTLYTGVTNNLIRRVYEHKNKLVEGFTKKYAVDKLVYYEIHQSIEAAILREKRIKHWNRSLRVELIEMDNPRWKDLYEDLVYFGSPSSGLKAYVRDDNSYIYQLNHYTL